MFKRFFHESKGMTLVETLAVAGILMMIFAAAAMNIYSYRQIKELDAVTNNLFVVINLARQKAVASEENSSWGVRLENLASGNHFYSLFASSTYSVGAERQRYFISNRVKFSNPGSGQSRDFIFERSVGRPIAGNATSATLYLVYSPANTKTITVNNLGKAEVQ